VICDFCRLPDPVWEFPCEEFDLPGYHSFGPWCACERCRELVDARDDVALARRAHARNPGVIPLDIIQAVQGQFFIHQTGDARPIRETPMHGRTFVR
jgi:hypothetical protein